MEQLLDVISEKVGAAFEAAGYDRTLGRVQISNRPDLCEFQCNGAMAGAKQYHKAPFMIADAVAAELTKGETRPDGTVEESVFESAESVKPGFLNLKLKPAFLAGYLEQMREAGADGKWGLPAPEKKKKIIIDYGGPNVAKPLHVGHLRSAVIGEALKRLARYNGQDIIGDIHLGDWGLQMGLVITELRKRHPEWVYFDDNYTGAYPEEAPFTVSDLEEVYPFASKRSKEDEDYYAEAMFYHLGKTSGKKQISYKDSQKAIEHTITLAGYNPKNYRIADGSGVSLYNYVSPELEVGILRYAYQHTDIYQHLYPSLPIAGVDGTLAKRMQSGTAFKNVRAKTGTVTGISSLAGFCTAKNGHLLAFCIINQGIMKTFIGHRFQDSVCQILTE